MYMEKTPTKTIRTKRNRTRTVWFTKTFNSDSEEEDYVSTGEPRAIHTPSRDSGSETEQPRPEKTQAGPVLTPATDEQTLRRSIRNRRPATLFTYNALGQPTLQAHSSVSRSEVYEVPNMAFWGMQPYPLSPYPVPVSYHIPSPYLPHSYTLSVFHNRPTR